MRADQKFRLTFYAFTICCLLIGANALAEKHALVVGGSGEDFKSENFFIDDFTRFNSSLVKRGFHVQLIFDNNKSDGKFTSVSANNLISQEILVTSATTPNLVTKY
jgi:hypothetical protein